MLRCVHLDELGCVTLKGAHEWRLPLQRDRFTKHSIERNTHICFDLIAKGKLHVGELISREISSPTCSLPLAIRSKQMCVLRSIECLVNRSRCSGSRHSCAPLSVTQPSSSRWTQRSTFASFAS